jgi:predicted transcriptional regulator
MAATVRIRPDTHDKLQKIANQSGQSMLAVLDEAVETLRRQRMLTETDKAFESLKRNPNSWKEELAEREAWDGTLGDDLDE